MSKYRPLDEVLASAPIRILRCLRWFGWIDGPELLEACDAPVGSLERDTLTSAMCRMTKRGEIERRSVVSFYGAVSQFRITPKGRNRLDQTFTNYTLETFS